MPRGRFARWFHKVAPTRDSLESNRWLRPFAQRMMHSALWRFTRRSVPRGVALGMVTGILVPMGQIPASALLALPFRANIPAAAATTFFTNPLTTPPLWVAAYWIGSWMLGAPVAHAAAAAETGMAGMAQATGAWLYHQGGPALLTGLLTLTLVLSLIGYFGSAMAWRIWIARRWRRRQAERRAAAVLAAGALSAATGGAMRPDVPELRQDD